VSEFAGSWVRSSFCEAQACVEVATYDDDVLVRDGKDVDQPFLRFSAIEWTDFLDGVAAGEFKF
jgi:hypothetical protein